MPALPRSSRRSAFKSILAAGLLGLPVSSSAGRLGSPEWTAESAELGPADPADNNFALNPTGGPVRHEGMDGWGGGEYLARRNDPDSRGLSLHHAIDFVGKPGQEVVAPISGQMKKTGRGINTGCVITGRIGGDRHKVKLMHFAVTAPEGFVAQGQVIGRVKDIGKVYKGMTPHVHMEVQEWRSHFGYRAKDPGIVVRPAPAAARGE